MGDHDHGLKFLIYRPIYRISAFIEAIFATENRLEEKSKKIGKCQRYFAEISVINRNIGRHIEDWGHVRMGKFFWIFLGDISPIFSIYRQYIDDAACVAQICCAENPTVQIYPPFQRLVCLI